MFDLMVLFIISWKKASCFKAKYLNGVVLWEQSSVCKSSTTN